jgi:hypothetical protein
MMIIISVRLGLTQIVGLSQVRRLHVRVCINMDDIEMETTETLVAA